MEDLKKIIEELNNKEKENKCCENKKCKCIEKEEEYNNDNFWITALVLLGMLSYQPIKEEKQPIINIYIGGEK